MNITEPGLQLSHEELVSLTGYARAHEQLAELLSRGYHRAHRNRLGHVVLTRAHFDAVERGSAPAPARPKVRMLRPVA